MFLQLLNQYNALQRQIRETGEEIGPVQSLYRRKEDERKEMQAACEKLKKSGRGQLKAALIVSLITLGILLLCLVAGDAARSVAIFYCLPPMIVVAILLAVGLAKKAQGKRQYKYAMERRFGRRFAEEDVARKMKAGADELVLLKQKLDALRRNKNALESEAQALKEKMMSVFSKECTDPESFAPLAAIIQSAFEHFNKQTGKHISGHWLAEWFYRDTKSTVILARFFNMPYNGSFTDTLLCSGDWKMQVFGLAVRLMNLLMLQSFCGAPQPDTLPVLMKQAGVREPSGKEETAFYEALSSSGFFHLAAAVSDDIRPEVNKREFRR